MYGELNFLELYLSAVDYGTVPMQYNEWACLSLVAACLNDRCWMEKYPGKPLFPWLYVILSGESGSGKDFAIDHASSFVKDEDAVFEFYGRMSGAGLAHVLANRGASAASADGKRPTVWLVLPELSLSIGDGKLAKDFIRRLTGLSGGKDKNYREVTRALMMESQEIEYGSPLINALMGSTSEWLVGPEGCVSINDVLSGAFARIMLVSGTFDPTNRVYRPQIPRDYNDRIKELKQRVRDICRMEGEFILSEKADQVMERWIMTRPEPKEKTEQPLWARDEMNALKLGMIISAMSGRYDRMITSKEAVQAQRYVEQAAKAFSNLFRFAARTSDDRLNSMELVAEIIKKAGRIQHSPLLKRLAHHGMHTDDLRRHIRTLIERDEVAIARSGSGGRVYEWVGR